MVFRTNHDQGQSDIDNDASVFKALLESYREPPESDKEQSESADKELYKEHQESSSVQYVPVSTTGQHHKLRPRSTAKVVAIGKAKVNTLYHCHLEILLIT